MQSMTAGDRTRGQNLVVAKQLGGRSGVAYATYNCNSLLLL
jgi:hypothetical protein